MGKNCFILHNVWYNAMFCFQEKINTDNTPMFLVVSEQLCTKPRILQFSHFFLLSYQWGGPKELKLYLNWPKLYSIPNDIKWKKCFDLWGSYYLLGQTTTNVISSIMKIFLLLKKFKKIIFRHMKSSIHEKIPIYSMILSFFS